MLALATDFNSESDLRRMLPKGVELFTSRILNANPLTIEHLKAISENITPSSRGILPRLGVDVMIYGCTSGTAAICAGELQWLIQTAQPGVPCTNPIYAAGIALSAFGARKLSILTPYTQDINVAVRSCFQDRGFQILNIEGFGLEDDIEMTGLPLSAISEAAQQVCAPDADALFISCTALRSASVAGALEQKQGKPVVASNQALVWHCLQLMNNHSSVTGFGRLFRLSIKTPIK